MDNRATITIDEFIIDLVQNQHFMPGGTKLGYAAVVGQLWERLSDKGDDPRYKRLVLAQTPRRFNIIQERDLNVTGVFARYSAVPYIDLKNNRVAKSIFGPQREETLVVVPNIEMERDWGMKLAGLGYQVHKI